MRRGFAPGAALALAVAAVLLVLARRLARGMGGGGTGDPPGGVREPRRPLQPSGSGTVTADPS